MRKVIAAIVLGIFMSTFAYAQQQSERGSNDHRGRHHHQRGERTASPEERVDRMLTHLTEKLDLTEAQQAEIRAFHLEQMKEGKALMEEAENREARQEIRKTHREQMNRKMESLLTEAQMVKYKEMKEVRGEKRGERRGHRNGRSQ